MKYGFTTLGLFLILFVTLFIQNASSQVATSTGPTPQEIYEQNQINNQQILNSILDPNTGLPEGLEQQISIEQIPSIPKPGETVSIKIVSYSTDLNKALITWTLDGRSLYSQIGATKLDFQAPQSGKTSNLVITIRKESGGTISKTITISPADVDLFYEAQTYAHPFYKGKKMYTSESLINFIAVPNFVNPNGTKIPDSNLVYLWRINGVAQNDESGYGKNTFLTKGSLIERSNQISVEVSAVNSTLKASQTLNFKSTSPEVVLYENNPILGIVYEHAIQGSFNLERPQVDFEAIPYYYSADFKDAINLDYGWTINGAKIATKAVNENYLVLRNDQNIDGKALIGSTLQHSSNILQTTQTYLELNFKKVENEPNEQFNF